jgi:hypothetical protein
MYFTQVVHQIEKKRENIINKHTQKKNNEETTNAIILHSDTLLQILTTQRNEHL